MRLSSARLFCPWGVPMWIMEVSSCACQLSLSKQFACLLCHVVTLWLFSNGSHHPTFMCTIATHRRRTHANVRRIAVRALSTTIVPCRDAVDFCYCCRRNCPMRLTAHDWYTQYIGGEPCEFQEVSSSCWLPIVFWVISVRQPCCDDIVYFSCWRRSCVLLLLNPRLFGAGANINRSEKAGLSCYCSWCVSVTFVPRGGDIVCCFWHSLVLSLLEILSLQLILCPFRHVCAAWRRYVCCFWHSLVLFSRDFIFAADTLSNELLAPCLRWVDWAWESKNRRVLFVFGPLVSWRSSMTIDITVPSSHSHLTCSIKVLCAYRTIAMSYDVPLFNSSSGSEEIITLVLGSNFPIVTAKSELFGLETTVWVSRVSRAGSLAKSSLY